MQRSIDISQGISLVTNHKVPSAAVLDAQALDPASIDVLEYQLEKRLFWESQKKKLGF